MTIQRVYSTFQQKGLAGELARACAPYDFDNAVVAAGQTIRPGEGVYLVSGEWTKPAVGSEHLITHVASFECATVGTSITAPTTNDDLEIVFGEGDVMKALALGSIYVVAGATVSKGDLAIFDAADDQWDGYTPIPGESRAASFVFLNDAVDGGIVEIRNCGSIDVLPVTVGLRDGIAAVIATAGDETYTAAQVLAGLILRDPNGGARADTTPTALELIAVVGDTVGRKFDVVVVNTADAAEEITVGGGVDVTIVGTATIGQNDCKRFIGVVTSATEVSLYSVGTSVF